MNAQTVRGLSCRRCGCQELRVVYTRRRSGSVLMRRRECKQCGGRFTTWEQAIATG
jgi:transcriptional regulator NrdR family protein